jgi:hypothetical protein
MFEALVVSATTADVSGLRLFRHAAQTPIQVSELFRSTCKQVSLHKHSWTVIINICLPVIDIGKRLSLFRQPNTVPSYFSHYKETPVSGLLLQHSSNGIVHHHPNRDVHNRGYHKANAYSKTTIPLASIVGFLPTAQSSNPNCCGAAMLMRNCLSLCLACISRVSTA